MPPTFPRTSFSGCSEPMFVITRKRRPSLHDRKDTNSKRGSDGRLARPSRANRGPRQARCWLDGVEKLGSCMYRQREHSFAAHPTCDTLFRPMSQRIRVFATCDIGDALNILRDKGYDLEVYSQPEAPPKRLIIDKVASGVDGLITTLRDPIDAKVFAAGVGTLKVVAQYAVGFDNINRADANHYKVPFTHTADVLTEATAEFAFFLMGSLARKLWPAEHLTRELRWGYWHPYLPFLGDEVTGKTVAVIGTGRIGLAFIKKCAGFDMNILCFDPAYENHEYIKAIQEVKDLRFQRGISRERATIRYTTLHEALSTADFIS